MSEQATLLTTELLKYLTSHTASDDDFMVRLKKGAAKAGLPAIWIAPEQAAFIQVLLRLANAKTVIEVGTLAGYSAIAMAQALPADGHLHTIEINDKHVDIARTWIRQSDVAEQITIHHGDGLKLLGGFKDASMDAAFIDADKDNYPRYLDECCRVVKPGGLIMVDNAFAFGQLLDDTPTKDEVWAIRAFNDLVHRRDDLASIIAPIGDGMWICVRKDD